MSMLTWESVELGTVGALCCTLLLSGVISRLRSYLLLRKIIGALWLSALLTETLHLFSPAFSGQLFLSLVAGGLVSSSVSWICLELKYSQTALISTAWGVSWGVSVAVTRGADPGAATGAVFRIAVCHCSLVAASLLANIVPSPQPTRHRSAFRPLNGAYPLLFPGQDGQQQRRTSDKTRSISSESSNRRSYLLPQPGHSNSIGYQLCEGCRQQIMPSSRPNSHASGGGGGGSFGSNSNTNTRPIISERRAEVPSASVAPLFKQPPAATADMSARDGRRVSLPVLPGARRSSHFVSAGSDSTVPAAFSEADGLLADLMADEKMQQCPHLYHGVNRIRKFLQNCMYTFSAVNARASFQSSQLFNFEDDMNEVRQTPYMDSAGAPPSAEYPPGACENCVLCARCEHMKRLHASSAAGGLQPSSNVHRRMSAGLFTTTTSATGMPILDAEPIHKRNRALSYAERRASLSRSNTSDHDEAFLPFNKSRSVSPRRASASPSPQPREFSPVDKMYHIHDSSIQSPPSIHVECPLQLAESTDSDSAVQRAFDKHGIQPSVFTSHSLSLLNTWNFPIFDFELVAGDRILTTIAYQIFQDCGLFGTFEIDQRAFIEFFVKLEDGYWPTNTYHTRTHAADVLQSVYWLTTNEVPYRTHAVAVSIAANKTLGEDAAPVSSVDTGSGGQSCGSVPQVDISLTVADKMTALEHMALLLAAAMHDYDHPGRTNAFLVDTSDPLAILYNDRSVLESHHAASSWKLLMQPENNFLSKCLDAAELKRLRFLVLEAILATDLKKHFEFLAQLKSKFFSELADPTQEVIDWSSELDRILYSQLCIKLADIGGSAKKFSLHKRWSDLICEEFYRQGDEEARRGLPVSAFMSRTNPQKPKLQESFIMHMVAPMCELFDAAGLIPKDQEEVLPVPSCISEPNSPMTSVAECSDIHSANSSASPNGDGIHQPPMEYVESLVVRQVHENLQYWQEVAAREIQETEKKSKLIGRLDERSEEDENSSSEQPGTVVESSPGSELSPQPVLVNGT